MPRTKESGRHERRIAYMAEIDMDVRELVAERDALRGALQQARSLANRVMDKDIGPLSEQARELVGVINAFERERPE